MTPGARLRSVALVILLALMHAVPCHAETRIREAGPDEVRAYFQEQKCRVVTFLGYSDAGYEDPKGMKEQATRILQSLDPAHTLVNIGATPSGIGEVYEIARKMGFRTTGIVSTQARDFQVPLSPQVDVVFYVPDASWGGFLPGTRTLSPTSQAMVRVSDLLVAIGGGEVARDEILAARDAGKTVTVIAAEMNHQVARERARKKGLPDPTDFRGAASALAESGSPVPK